MSNSVLSKAFSVNENGESKKPKQDIRTPLSLFNKLNLQFNFDLDPCDSNEKENWLPVNISYNLNRKENGLELTWFGNVFVNPPWNNIFPWIKKAESELKEGNCNFVVFLLPSRVETKWWHHLLGSKHFMNLTYLPSRVKFDDHPDSYVIGISIITLWRKLF